MATTTVNCPSCGAPADGAIVGEVSRCRYCTATFRVDARGEVRAQGSAGASYKSIRRVLFTVVGLVILVLAGAGVAKWSLMSMAPPEPVAPVEARIVVPVVMLDGTAMIEVAAPEPAEATFTPGARYDSSIGSMYLLGMVQNSGKVRIKAPWVTAVFVNEAGDEVGTVRSKAQTDCLEPGENAPVKLLVQEPPAFTRIDWEVPASKASWCPSRVDGLRIESLPASQDSLRGWILKGKVVHGGTVPARFVRVDALAWGASGDLVGVSYAFAALQDDVLPAGESARYEVRMLSTAQVPERFEIRVRAQPTKAP